MSDETRPRHDDVEAAGHEHGAVHLPPPSFVPINIALALAILFVGFLGDIRNAIGPVMWIAGLAYLIVSCAFWARAARREYLELPEDSQH